MPVSHPGDLFFIWVSHEDDRRSRLVETERSQKRESIDTGVQVDDNGINLIDALCEYFESFVAGGRMSYPAACFDRSLGDHGMRVVRSLCYEKNVGFHTSTSAELVRAA